jgi:hypothetical protein
MEIDELIRVLNQHPITVKAISKLADAINVSSLQFIIT